ncbi:hypothetical protein CBW65_04580 [Tumebacillus avium]|uniref:DUF115 domain-containing protein n=1 Tax=Tumebacillus avium TaxID=1903704 RepID=A0A1Y0IM41_9BACL|nr:6-hydroxymethylpterin diphosphokinase MptE-like protein [Tumebacillus avium]ARU60423.1 hypothetical protein CBW65_04580 [Tumebacillus avium]
MSLFLEANEQALAIRRILFEQYTTIKMQQEQEHSVRIEPTKSGAANIVVEIEGQSSPLYSRYQPIVEAERWATAQKAEKKEEQSAFIVVGLGLGYHLRALRDLLGADLPLFIVEPSWQIFQAAMEAVDLSDLLTDHHVHLLVGGDFRQAAREASQFIGKNMFNAGWLEWQAYRRLFPEYLTSFAKETALSAKDVRIDHNTILHFQKEWPRNMMYNLNRILKNPGVNRLAGKFAGRPAIIVSAGPSLAKNVDLLHEVKGKAAILCVDTAYRVLQQRGIKPDLIFALDGTEKNYKHFTGVRPEGVPLVFLPPVHHKIVEEYGERSFSSNVFDPIIREATQHLEPRGVLNYSGSVATLAFETACLAGADPVIFIGQDLGYPGGQAYAPGTMFEDMKKEYDPKSKMLFVEGVDGQPVLTDPQLDKFRRYFEDRIEAMGKIRTYIDATEGGAKIQGTEISTLRETLDRYCVNSFDIDGIIDEAAQPPGDDLEPALNVLHTMHRTLHQIKRICRVALRKNVELRDLYKVKRLRPGKVAAANAALDRIDQNLKRLNEKQWLDLTMQHLLLVLTQGKLSKAPANETDQAKAMRVTANADLLYTGMLQAAHEINSHVEVALERVQQETKQGATV